MTVRCRTCILCEPNGQGTNGAGQQIDIGICRGSPARLTVANSGAFPPVALDTDWCAHHPDFNLPKRARSNA